MKNILICMVLVVVAFCATDAWAVGQTINVSATVPPKTLGLSIGVSKVVGTDPGAVWTTASSMSFGTLELDPVNKIFLPVPFNTPTYFAVDIGVEDNNFATAWTVMHTRASLAGQGTNIDNKVNVIFKKQTSKTAGTELLKVSFGNSQSKPFSEAQLAGGWLRIYYGLGTGDLANPDATDVTPIGFDTPSGTYSGSVTITLTAV